MVSCDEIRFATERQKQMVAEILTDEALRYPGSLVEEVTDLIRAVRTACVGCDRCDLPVGSD